MPNAPLLAIKESERGDVELVLEQAQVSVAMLLVSV